MPRSTSLEQLGTGSSGCVDGRISFSRFFVHFRFLFIIAQRLFLKLVHVMHLHTARFLIARGFGTHTYAQPTQSSRIPSCSWFRDSNICATDTVKHSHPTVKHAR